MGQKQEVDAYLTSFRSVLQLLNAYKELSKLEILELEPAMNRVCLCTEKAGRISEEDPLLLLTEVLQEVG